MKYKIANLLIWCADLFVQGVVVEIQSRTWKEDKGVWFTTFLHYRPHKDRLWIDWENRKIDIEKNRKQ